MECGERLRKFKFLKQREDGGTYSRETYVGRRQEVSVNIGRCAYELWFVWC